MTQSRYIASRLEKAHSGLKVELVEITTTGDEVRDKPLKSFGGAGVFVKELENALQDKRVDIAVHSLKDMPTRQPEGLVIGAIAGREDPRDVVVTQGGRKLADLPAKSIIGSGSMRRRAQLKAAYPQLDFTEIRGNVDTRLRKVREGQVAGTILALAGLKRLGLLEDSMQTLSLEVMLPAPGQGALAIECRSGDLEIRKLLQPLHEAEVEACIDAERVVLEALGGGCHLPLAALGTVVSGKLRLQAFFGLPDGLLSARADETMDINQSRELGKKVAQILLDRGGREILQKL
jgi:hydroxymethylbilane synthase